MRSLPVPCPHLFSSRSSAPPPHFVLALPPASSCSGMILFILKGYTCETGQDMKRMRCRMLSILPHRRLVAYKEPCSYSQAFVPVMMRRRATERLGDV
jgi:hypothetical protein